MILVGLKTLLVRETVPPFSYVIFLRKGVGPNPSILVESSNYFFHSSFTFLFYFNISIV